MEGMTFNYEEVKYCFMKGISSNLPSFYFNRKDIHMMCNVLYNEIDPPHLFVYVDFNGCLFLVFDEEFTSSFDSNNEEIANAIINQLQENHNFLEQMESFISFMDSHKH